MRKSQADDRLQAIAKLSADELARRLEQLPPVAAWLLNRGRLSFATEAAGRTPTRRALAEALADSDVIALTLRLLDPASFQLVLVLAIHGGHLDRARLDHELDPLPPAERDRIIRRLADQFVIDEPAPRLPISLRPGVAQLVALPGRALDRVLLDQSIGSDEIGAWARELGLKVPAKKSDRLAAVRSVLSDRAKLTAAVARLGAPAQELFERLADAGGQGVSAGSVGISVWQLRPAIARGFRTMPRLPTHIEAAQQLADRGIMWIDHDRGTLGLWLEALAAANGRTFTRWPVELQPHLVPVDDLHQPGSHTLSTIELLLQHLATQPLPGLKTGGIGVKAMRDLAKAVGRDVLDLETIVNLAVATGLVARTIEPSGKGRAATIDCRFEVDPRRVEHWRASPATTRWIELVAAWIDALDAEPERRILTGLVRRSVLADLLQLPEGVGVRRDELGTWMRTRHGLANYVDADELANDLTMIGLCHPIGPIGLGAVARTLLVHPDQLESIVPTLDATIVVQADFSVIAPPGLDPAVRARLDRLSITESTGSVTVLRLDRERIGAAIAAGDTPDDLLDFLATHSSVELPDSISRLMHDAERQQGGLTVTGAATVVTADDVLGLAAAVKVKAAKLTLIAPTVAISPLPPAKVLALLRAKGLAPRTPVAEPSPLTQRYRPPLRDQPALPDVLHPDRARLLEVISRW